MITRKGATEMMKLVVTSLQRVLATLFAFATLLVFLNCVHANAVSEKVSDSQDPIGSARTPPFAPSLKRSGELRYLLKHDCGSCHGMTLKGGLGPALTRDALKGRSVEEIASVIRYGRSALGMPPWSPFLSQEEALWLAGILKDED